MTTYRSFRLLALLVLALPLALAACGGGSAEVNGGSTTEVSGGGVAAGACASAMLVRYDGHDYLGTALEVEPVPGDSLGNGTIPPCNDAGGAGTTVPAEQVEVTAVQGVPPTVAIMLAGRTDVVLVRDDVTKLPKELQQR